MINHNSLKLDKKMNKNTRNIIIILMPFSLFFISFSMQSLNDSTDPMVLTGLPYNISKLIFLCLIPYIGSIITVILFPRIIIPLYLKAKRGTMKNYKNVYLDVEKEDLNIPKFLKRTLYVALLSLGLGMMLINSNIIHPRLMMSEKNYQQMIIEGDSVIYYIGTLLGLPMLIYSIIIGLWAVGWTLEDAGVMHYNIKEKKTNNLFEIEPVHNRYNGMLKGFAGISVIIVLLSAYSYYISLAEPDIESISMVIFSIPMLMIPSFLSYIVYWKIGKNYTIKNLKEIRRITEEELISFLEKR